MRKMTYKDLFKKLAGNEKGFTLLEIVIASCIILVGIGTTTLFYSRFNSNDNIGASQKAALSISTKLKSSLGYRGYTGLTNDVANDLEAFPQDMVSDSGGTLVVSNRYNGTVFVSANTNTLLQEQTWTGLPKNACIEMALSSPDHWIAIDVNGTSIDSSSDTALATVSTACNDTGNSVTLITN